jgi:TonB family protein
MLENWKQCEGQTVDGRFRLEKFLASSESGAIFLTSCGEAQEQKAAIKFVDAIRADDSLLAQWRKAEQLSHPNLQKVYRSGRCRLANKEFLYVVEEFADENLGQVMPERALTVDEVREMLGPLTAAVLYLHGKGLVHTRIKPANILANGDRLLLCCDTLQAMGTPFTGARGRDIYDAPEAGSTGATAASDAWSLGITIVEALTQQPPKAIGSEAQVPETMPEPLQNVARKLLRTDPVSRGTMAEISAMLNPQTATATAEAVSPAAVPLSSVPAMPAAKLQTPKPVVPERKARSYAIKATQTVPPTKGVEIPSYAIPLGVIALIVLGVIFVPKMLNQSPKAASVSIAKASQAQMREKPTTEAKKAEVSQPAEVTSTVPDAGKTAEVPEKPTTKVGDASSAEALPAGSQDIVKGAAPASASAAIPTLQESAPAEKSSSAVRASIAKGEVLEQVLPEISAKAQATIHGTFFTSVRVQVDAAGSVTDAQFESAGPSAFFADLAMKAAKKWTFSPPEVGGRSAPSEWVIRFQFSQNGAQAFPRQQ